jgi:ACS family glucarate transporter-like MFS transporter
MLRIGWQMAVVWTSLPALGLIAWWAWYGRDTPQEHRSVQPGELAEIGARDRSLHGSTITAARIWRVLKNRNALLLFVSYTCMNYVFYLIGNWAFLYLVQERHFSILESGWLATGPPLAAGVGAGLSGLCSGYFCAKYGESRGYRLTPLIALPVSGLLLLAVIYAADPYLAVAALAFCFAVVELTEGSFWGCAMTVGGVDTMALTGFMNTGGNLGGIIGIPIVAHLSEAHQWNMAFYVGTGFALVSALCWFGIDADRRLVPVPASA